MSKIEDVRDIPSLQEIEMVLASKSLIEYVKYMWSVLEPGVIFKNNWHLEAICDHLEAILNDDIKHLLINLPPRHSKSLITSVFFPSYVWLHRPATQFLYSSYSQTLSIRDNIKTRRVIDSARYQDIMSLYSEQPFVLTDDQNTKIKFENNKGGHRIATSVGGTVTGDGGNFVCVDDAHNVKEAESKQIRDGVLTWWKETMQTRLNDPKNGHFLVCMQRSHESDLSGYIIDNDSGVDEWTQLILPARFEGFHRSKLTIDGFKDPRTEKGEPLWKDHFGDNELKRLERALGGYASAGQLQQNPAPRSGGMFDRANWVYITTFNRMDIVGTVRYWDKAGTQDGGAYSAGVLMHYMNDGTFIIADVVRGQWSIAKREEIILSTAHKDGVKTDIWVEQEPGSGGKESAILTIQKLKGFYCQRENPTGDKTVRANPLSAQVEIMNVKLITAPWNDDFVDEAAMFPNSKYKDQIDAASGAFNKLAMEGDEAGVW